MVFYFKMRIKAIVIKIRRTMKNFLSSSRGRDVMLYLLFVIIAFIFWAVLALNNKVQDNFHVKFQITGLPENITLIDNYPNQIDVIVKNTGYDILRYKFAREISVDAKFNNFSDGAKELVISQQDIHDLLMGKFGNEASLISFTPENINVKFTNLPGRKVPVRIKGNFDANFQYVINGEIKAQPDSVLLFGTEDVLNTVSIVETESVVKTDLRDTLNYNASIQAIPGSRCIPSMVDVVVPVEPLVLQKINIPLVPVNCKPGIKLVLFPSYVTVNYFTPISKFDYSVANQMKLIVDYNSIQKNSSKLPILISDVPDFCRNLKLSTDSVEFILEQ